MTRAIAMRGSRAGAIFIERAYREAEDGQFLRELTQNGIEAGATEIQFGVHWDGVDRDWSKVALPEGCNLYADRYRMVYYDNGGGMGLEMIDYLAGLIDLDSKDQLSGDMHENFGMGARISLLPWNRAGLIVASWSEAVPGGHLMWIRHRHDSESAKHVGHYEAINLEFFDENDERQISEVVPAIYFPEFTEGRPEWLGPQDDGTVGSGTMFLMLGNTGQENTFLGPEGQWKTHTGPNYLAHRFWEHPPNVNVRFEDPRSAKIETWKTRGRDRFGGSALDGTVPDEKQERVFNEPVRSAKDHVTGRYSKKTTGADYEAIDLPDGGKIHVHFRSADSATSGGGRRQAGKPAISVLYKHELYHRRDTSRDYLRFAVAYSSIRSRLSIAIEPRLAESMDDPMGGVFPTGSRSTLHYLQPFSGSGQRPSGHDLPWAVWQDIFVEKMPAFVRQAIDLLVDDDQGDEIDSDIIEKVAQPFMDIFSQTQWNEVAGGGVAGIRDGAKQEIAVRRLHPDRKPGEGDSTAGDDAKLDSSASSSSGGATLNGGHVGEKQPVPAMIPNCRFDANAFDEKEREGSIRVGVKYVPGPKGDLGTVLIDRSFPIFSEIRDYWCDRFAVQHKKQVVDAVESVYRVAFACRVGQILRMGKDVGVSVHDLQEHFLSAPALTSALYGLASEFAAISHKTSGLRKVKK